MRWRKDGLIFAPAGQAPWIGTHAALPVVVKHDGVCRVFFSSRDASNRSRIGYVTMDLSRPRDRVEVCDSPVLEPGRLGTFDDAGVTTSCAITWSGRLFFFYTGWSLGVTVPFYLSVGLATSDDGGQSLKRWSAAPLFDRSDVDPYLTASPWVVIEGELWRMWYVSGTEWTPTQGSPRHRYHIKYAESRDGLVWDRDGVVCIDYESPDEYAFGRPCVVVENGLYRMWYPVRGEAYRIGYAESTDGRRWVRKDHLAGIEPSPAGWDSDMITYPIVFLQDGRLMMLYNGNGYGRSGFGLASSVD